MSTEEMNRLRSLHVESAPEFQPECAAIRCEQDWPCDISKVIAAYDALRESHDALERERDELKGQLVEVIRGWLALRDGDNGPVYADMYFAADKHLTEVARWFRERYPDHPPITRAALAKAEALGAVGAQG